MLFEDEVIYEIKKENYALKALEKCVILEENLLMLGHDRTYVNASCSALIEAYDNKFKQELINEDASSIIQATVNFLAPGLGDYFKKLLLRYIFKKLNIDPNSPLAGFFVNVLRNIKYSELYNYFKSGRCPYIVESITKAVLDQFIDYAKGQLFSGAIKAGAGSPSADRIDLASDKYGSLEEPASGAPTILNPATYKKPEAGFPGYDRDDSEGPGFFEEKGMDLALGSGGEGAKRIFKFFEDAGDGPTTGGAVEEIIRANIKQHLLPNLSRQLSKIICEDLDYKELSAVTKSTVTQDKIKNKKKRTRI